MNHARNCTKKNKRVWYCQTKLNNTKWGGVLIYFHFPDKGDGIETMAIFFLITWSSLITKGLNWSENCAINYVLAINQHLNWFSSKYISLNTVYFYFAFSNNKFFILIECKLNFPSVAYIQHYYWFTSKFICIEIKAIFYTLYWHHWHWCQKWDISKYNHHKQSTILYANSQIIS